LSSYSNSPKIQNLICNKITENVDCIEEMSNAYTMLNEILKSLLKLGDGLEYNIYINLDETGFEIVDWVSSILNFGNGLFCI
jgi:hypothetical protein